MSASRVVFEEGVGVGRAVTLIAGAPAEGRETATTRVVTTVDEPAVEYLDLEKNEWSEEDTKGVEDELIVEEVLGRSWSVSRTWSVAVSCFKFASIMLRSPRRRL